VDAEERSPGEEVLRFKQEAAALLGVGDAVE
jgi:hypothetical protein